MSLLKTTIKTSFGKASSLLLDLGRNFLFIKTLSVEAFGLLSLGNNMIQSNKYLDLGFANKFLIDSYDNGFSSKESKQVFYAIVIFELFLLTLFGLVFILFFSNLDRSVNLDGDQLQVGIFLPLMLLLAFFSGRMYKLSLVWRRHKKKFIDIAVLEIVLSASLLAGSLLVLIFDFLTFANSYFFFQAVLFLILSISVFKIFPGTRQNFSWLLLNWKPSLLLTSSTFLYGLSFYFDRFILITFYGLTEIGNYSFLLFFLGIGSALITYGIQPIRAHIANTFADADENAQKKMIMNICKNTGLYICLIGLIFINLLTPTIKTLMNVIFDNYDQAIFYLHDVFNILLTMPVLNLLGYIVVAKPFYKTGIFAFSQLAGILCMALNFLIMGAEDSIITTLLIGIYYGNVLKILIYVVVMAGQQKWCNKNFFQLLFLFPFIFIPFLTYG